MAGLALPVTSLYVGLAGLLALFLALVVVKNRQKHKVALGDGGVGQLQQAQRVHANFVEYVPLALVFILILELQGAPSSWLHGLGTALIVGRVLHAYGLMRSPHSSPGRFVGTILTWLVYLFGAGACLFYAFS